MAFHVEVNFSGFPFIAGFGQECADQAQQGGFIGKDTGHARPAFEFHIDAFERIAGAQTALMGAGEGEDGKTLREVFFHPSGQFWGGGGVTGYHFFEARLGSEAVRTIEDRADGLGHGGALIQTRHIGLGILLQMKLATLPGHGREDGLPGGGQTLVVVADDELWGMQAALLQARQEGAPMDFGFAEGDADAQNGTFAVSPNAQGNEHGAIEDLAALADFFITGIQEDERQGSMGR